MDRAAVQVVGRQGGVVATESRRQQGGEVAKEGGRATDLHLDQQRLALVHRHAPRLAHRLVPPSLGQAGAVERMARLVQDRHQARGDVYLLVARRETDVVGHAAAERVRALVEPAALEIEPHLRHQPAAQRHLRCQIELPLDRQGRLLARQHLLQEIRQEGGQRLEQRVDLRRAQARLVAVEQGIVRAEIQRLCLGGGLLTGQAHDLAKCWRQRREVGIGAGIAPGHLGAGGGARQRCDQSRIEGDRTPVGALHLAQIGALPSIELRRLRLGLA
jgi:hypothetical protein